jgi:hypothetical protein
MFGSEGEKRIAVTLTLLSGAVLRGSVPSSASGSLGFELNREGVFLNFKDTTGALIFVAKSTIAQVIEGNEEKIAVMPELAHGKSPHKVLRVGENASPEAVRQAYMALAKIYHPDNYPAESTAPELAEYVAAMFQQITVAYTALKAVAAKAA